LQGMALAGFNAVAFFALGLPVIVVARHAPDLCAIERALRTRVPGGARKWRLIERAGPMEPAGPVWIQRANLEAGPARALGAKLAGCGNIPEPLRVGHCVAGAVATGSSHGRV